MTEAMELSNDDFVDAVRPLCTVIRALTAAAEPLISAIPEAESVAMAEIAEQHRFQSEWWPDPVETAFVNASLRVFGAADALAAYGRLFESDPIPVFAHLPLARSALDAAATAYWLAAPVGVEERVKRTEALALENAKQMKRFPSAVAKDKGTEALDRVCGGAQHLGWSSSRGKSAQIGGVSVPETKALIAWLVDDALHGESQIGPFLWSYLSGVTHGVPWALMQAADRDDVRTSALSGMRVPFVTRAESVILLGLTVARAFATMVDRVAALLGWVSEDFERAHSRLLVASKSASDAVATAR